MAAVEDLEGERVRDGLVARDVRVQVVAAVVLGGQDGGVLGVGQDGGEVDGGVKAPVAAAAAAEDPVVDGAAGALPLQAAVGLVLAAEGGDGGAEHGGEAGVPRVGGDRAERPHEVRDHAVLRRRVVEDERVPRARHLEQVAPVALHQRRAQPPAQHRVAARRCVFGTRS